MTRVCLFDVDGTLVDSREPILRALNSALAADGLEPMTGPELRRHVGPPLQFALRSLLADRGDDLSHIDTLVETYRGEYKAISVGLAKSFPGVAELLGFLAGQVRLGVVTSKPYVYSYPILDALGFAEMMEIVEGPDLAEVESKQVTLERALQRLGVDPSVDDVTMIGDRHHDIDAGRAHSTRTIGVTWGFGSRDELAQAGADHIVDSPAEIAPIVTAS